MPTTSAQAKNTRSWKTTQASSKTKKKIKLALAILLSLAILLVLGQLINFTKVLFGPWQSTSQSKDYLWDDSFNINVAVLGSPISLLTFNPQQSKVTIIPLPDQTYLAVPQDYGFWQIRAVYGLGGGRLVKEALASFLGIPLDGFIKLDGALSQKGAPDLVQFIRSSPLNIIAALKNLQTDLTLLELVRLNLALNKVRFDKVQTLDLVGLNVLTEETLPDGTQVLTADPVRIDGVLKLEDPKLQKDYLTIAVFNATNVPLLAQKAKRLITNLGGNVIQTGNTTFALDKTYISGEDSATLQRLIQIFGLGCAKDLNCDKLDPKDLEQISSRARINIILGEDFAKRYGH